MPSALTRAAPHAFTPLPYGSRPAPTLYPVERRLALAVATLAMREREVAEIVILRGEVSAGEVERSLSVLLTNAAVRSMLNRLVAKGVLRRRKEGKKFLYAPSGCDTLVHEAALRRLCRDHFGGSLSTMVEAALALARAQEADAATLPRRFGLLSHDCG